MARHTKCRVSAVMADDQNANRITKNPEEKMIRKAAQIDPSEVTVANSVEFWPPGSVLEEITQLGIKFVRKFGSSYALVVLHDLIDVGVTLRVKDEPPHQVRRRSIFW